MSDYRPQRRCGKVMFLRLSVILFTGAECVSDTHPSRQTHTPLGRHPQADNAPWETPRADTATRQAPPPPSKQTVTAADGTHPAEMYSC